MALMLMNERSPGAAVRSWIGVPGRSTAWRSGLLAAALLLLGACVTTSDSTTEYFLLNSTAVAGDAVELDSFRVGVGPVELAAYLNQEGIANHLASNQIKYADDRRWAEPLDSNISQVLLSNLTTLLPNQTVYPFPWKVAQAPDYQLIIDINRFGWFPGNRVAIKARVVVEDKSGIIVWSGQENLDLAAAGGDYQSIVSAQNSLLERFSGRLVAILQSVVTS